MAESKVFVGKPESYNQPTTDASLAGTITAVKDGNVVSIVCNGNFTVTGTGSGWTNFATLKSALRPGHTVYIVAIDNAANYYDSSPALNMQLTSNGTLQVWIYSDKLTVKPRFTVTYIQTI